MARKRITRKLTDTSSRQTKHTPDNGSDAISGSVTSSVRVILLLLIGLGIVAFLFYPDISRIASMVYKGEGSTSTSKVETREDNSMNTQKYEPNEKVAPVRQERELRNDPMQSEEDEDEVEIYEPEDEDYFEDESEKQVNDKTRVKETEKETKKKPEVEETKNKKMKDDTSESATVNEAKMLKFSPGEDGKQFMELKLEDFKKEESKEEPKKVPKKEPKKSQTKKQPTKGSASEETNKDLPKEIRDFKPKILSSVTAKKIFADGRRIPPIELLAQKPTNSSVKPFLFDDFLSKEECDGLMNAHDRHVQEATKQDPILCFDSIKTLRLHLKEAKKKISVTPNVFTSGTTCVNATFSRQLKDWFQGNWSYSTAFYPGESKFSTIFANRVKAAMGLDQDNGGKFQLTSYPQGKAYKSHTDCVVDGRDKRDRVATVLVYLQDVEEGGETRFPELGIWVKPRKGRALVWNNMSPDGKCEPHSIHTASKVDKGNKYVLIRWYYYKSFYSLGKRPPEPPLPERSPGQPRVSCDEFEYGSCRWYDEWSYEHLLEYERQKMTLI